MLQNFVYFSVGIFSSVVGSIVGMGGGVILKPALDAIGGYDVATISILSSSTVLAMAFVSISKSLMERTKLQGKIAIFLSIGSIIGGILGKVLFDYFLITLSCEWYLCIMQSFLLIGMLIAVIELYNHKERYIVHRSFDQIQIIGLGLILGMISSFLGIGGGPLNVPILTILFSMDTRVAALHSIIVIFFSQTAAMVNVGLTTGFKTFNLEMLWVMIIGGVIGGLLGSIISKNLSLKGFGKVFNTTVMVIIVLNMFNIYKFIEKIN
ncbi:MAG: sulfite exporter TauE/SafE family protein [Eubacteriales bacterium]|nr:sulfite exporter TauE/SafE family protein [Eubacteriales bacterium]